MKTTRVLLKNMSGGQGNMHSGGWSSGNVQRAFGPNQTPWIDRPKSERIGHVDRRYGHGEEEARTLVKDDPEYEISRNMLGVPPYPDEAVHGSSTARRTGFLYKFPTRKYPNPKRHRPIMITPQVNLMYPKTNAHALTTRNALPLEKKGKKVIHKIEYKRPIPPMARTRKEMYNRMKFGLFDLDRVMPPLWGPQEGYKLDRDEWLFKMLYFLHPIKEEDLCEKVERFPHCPFDSRKDVVLGLERLTSREYARRVKGLNLHHPSVKPNDYYWTLMPDELDFGEKIVVEEHYMQKMKEGRLVQSPQYPLRKELMLRRYQEKHNTYLHIDDTRDLQKLKAFVAFCDAEKEATLAKLQAIDCTVEFPVDEEDEPPEYPDPPTLLSNYHGKIRWHTTGHWSDSIPDGRMSGPAPV
ncbi:hypothetical protein DIPPA_33031 [Diplonema papillatum]|nr:hypothetical protein DIPPA_33031 [Diplonema papillatum]